MESGQNREPSAGIYLENCENVVTAGNVVAGYDHGIHAKNTKNLTATANVLLKTFSVDDLRAALEGHKTELEAVDAIVAEIGSGAPRIGIIEKAKGVLATAGNLGGAMALVQQFLAWLSSPTVQQFISQHHPH